MWCSEIIRKLIGWACTYINRNVRRVRPAKIQIGLHIRAVLSDASLGAFWIAKGDKKIFMLITKILTRFHRCAGLFEYSLDVYLGGYVFSHCGSYVWCLNEQTCPASCPGRTLAAEFDPSKHSSAFLSILYKSIADRYRPVRVADGPITARYRFVKNASWGCVTKTRTKPTFSKL